MELSPSFSVSCRVLSRSGVVLASLLVSSLAAVVAQEPMLPVPPNVTVDGVPPIPLAVLDAISPYSQYRRARLVSWHPTERSIVIATRFGEVPQLHEVRFPGGARRQLT